MGCWVASLSFIYKIPVIPTSSEFWQPKMSLYHDIHPLGTPTIEHHWFRITLSHCIMMAGALLSHFSHVRLFVTLWTVACQASLSTGISRQEHWGGLSCPAPGDLPDSGIETTSLCLLHWQAGFFLPLVPPGRFLAGNKYKVLKEMPESWITHMQDNQFLDN